ncbi:MAG TPA: hypothetical protein VM599_00215 [Thermoanaerobaculia bacterium]|nr:hypothetical protein [Thermoanaerobaculia bacterium]
MIPAPRRAASTSARRQPRMRTSRLRSRRSGVRDEEGHLRLFEGFLREFEVEGLA